MEVLFEDKNIIVIKKPAGVATQSANITQKDCVSLIKEHLRKTEANISSGEPYVGVIHRLDQPVAGILVFAKDSNCAAILSKQVQGELMCKKYHAAVEGIVDVCEETELTNVMYKDSRESKAVVLDGDVKSKKAGNIKLQTATLYYKTELISEETKSTLLAIRLVTGRFHQIRAQLSAMGHPILGDKKYGSQNACPEDFIKKVSGKENIRNSIALVADELTFVHPVTKKEMHFEL